jgi:FixJ family two-component response regulator
MSTGMTTTTTGTAAATIQPTVFIVDDDPAIRRSLAMILEAHKLPSKSYGSADEFLAEFDPVAGAGCLLLDLRMPGTTGEQLLRTLRQGGARVPVIIVTGHGDVPVAVRSMKLGAVDFLQKPVDGTSLIDAVRRALAEDEARRKREAEGGDAAARVSRLTPREREMMGFLAKGRTSKEIAHDMGVSVKTVDNHRAHLLQKLRASNVAELAAIAVRAGLG